MKHFPLAIIALSCCICSTTAFGQNCVANFTFVQTCNTVKFTPDSLEAGITYKWDFGVAAIGTDISSLQMPTYTYFNADSVDTYTFNVQLTIVDTITNCTNTAMQVVTINVTDLPNVSLSTPLLANPFVYCQATQSMPNYTLLVQNTSTSNSTNNIFQIMWGDGTPPFMATNPLLFITTSHTYTTRGLFDIVYIIENDNGCFARDTFEFFNGNQPAPGLLQTNANQQLCIPTCIQIPFNQFVINQDPPGTVYQISIASIGLDTAITNPPPSLFFEYCFTKTSCELDNTPVFIIQTISTNACLDLPSSTSIALTRPPKADFSLSHDTICPNDILVVTNLSTPALYVSANSCSDSVSAFWSITPNSGYTIITGTLGSYPIPVGSFDGLEIAFNVPGDYILALDYGPYFPAECPRDTFVKAIQVLPDPCQSGVMDLFATQTLEVFPNPTNDDIAFVRLPAGATELRWFDPTGQQHHMLRLPNGEAIAQLDLSGMPAGIYFLQVKTAGRWFTGRLCRTK